MVRVGLALGGGGARGPAHAGVLRVLRAYKETTPSILAGTSAGSIIATLYAVGLPQDQIETAVSDFDWFRDVINVPLTTRSVFETAAGGVVSNARLGQAISHFMDGRGFNDLEMDLALTAVDMESRRRVIFTSRRIAATLDPSPLERFLPAPARDRPGCETIVISDYSDIGQAVRASCAIPGLFQPVEIRGMRLLDGGVLDQVPVDVVCAMRADVTVGVSLGLSYHRAKLAHPSDALADMVGLLGIQQLRRSLDMADVGFQLEGIEGRSVLKTHQTDLINLGERAMQSHMSRLLLLIEQGQATHRGED